MASWTDYKNHVRQTNPEIGKDIDEAEAVSKIVGAMIRTSPHSQYLPKRACRALRHSTFLCR